MLGWFWVMTGVPYVATEFDPHRDHVATEVPLSHQDGLNKRSGLRQSLVKARRFCVVT